MFLYYNRPAKVCTFLVLYFLSDLVLVPNFTGAGGGGYGSAERQVKAVLPAPVQGGAGMGGGGRRAGRSISLHQLMMDAKRAK